MSIDDIALLEDYIVLFRSASDVSIYFVGSKNDNELLLAAAMSTFCHVINFFMKFSFVGSFFRNEYELKS